MDQNSNNNESELPSTMTTFEPSRTVITNSSDLVGRTFLLPEQEVGQKLRGKIIECIDKYNDQLNSNTFHKKIRWSIK